MTSYWDRLQGLYTRFGDADFYLKHRLRLLEGVSGSALEACCGGGRLVVEMLKAGVDAYGIDLSPRMIESARKKLARDGFDPERASVADVTHLPFTDGRFDVVISTGAIALFAPAMQRAALAEMARAAKSEVRLLEAFELRKGFYGGRLLAAMFDGMRPIPAEIIQSCGLSPERQWDIFGGAFSYVRCKKE